MSIRTYGAKNNCNQWTNKLYSQEIIQDPGKNRIIDKGLKQYGHAARNVKWINTPRRAIYGFCTHRNRFRHNYCYLWRLLDVFAKYSQRSRHRAKECELSVKYIFQVVHSYAFFRLSIACFDDYQYETASVEECMLNKVSTTNG